MSPAVQAVGGLTGEQMAHVLAATEAAPTFRGSRPWHLHCTATAAELRVTRSSGTGDEKDNAADSRELLLACGAALFNARAAIRGFSLDPAVQLLPDQRQPDLLAVLRPAVGSPAGAGATAIAAAITADHDHGDGLARRPPGQVDRSQLDRLRRAARTEHAWLAVFPPGYLRDDDDPIPTAARPPAAGGPPEPLVAVIGTIHDVPLSWLHAGQATQLVRLTATTLGLTASLLHPPLNPAARKELRDRIGGALWPQSRLRLLRR